MVSHNIISKAASQTEIKSIFVDLFPAIESAYLTITEFQVHLANNLVNIEEIGHGFE